MSKFILSTGVQINGFWEHRPDGIRAIEDGGNIDDILAPTGIAIEEEIASYNALTEFYQGKTEAPPAEAHLTIFQFDDAMFYVADFDITGLIAPHVEVEISEGWWTEYDIFQNIYDMLDGLVARGIIRSFNISNEIVEQ